MKAMRLILPISVLLLMVLGLGWSLRKRVTVISPGKTVTVSFDYDFRLTHACSVTIRTGCVMGFNVYDITGDSRKRLFTVPVPPGAAGIVKGIHGVSEPMAIAPGTHLIGVAAQAVDGAESDPHLLTTTVVVGQ